MTNKVSLVDSDVGWYNENTAENIISSGVISANVTKYPSALPVQFAATPSNSALRRCKFTIRDGANSLFPDFAGNVASVSATQIVAKIRFSVAGNGTTSGSSLLVRVG